MLGGWAVLFPFDNITAGGMSNGNPELVKEGRSTACFSNLEMDALPVMGKS